MSEKKLVAQFKVDQREFSLKLYQYEFTLELKQVFKRSTLQPQRNAWLAFADEPTYEDVSENINAFAVMQQAREHLVNYIQRQQPRYFYFHASTARKARIYPRFAQRLIQHLPKYRYCQDGQSFYFYALD